MEILVLLLSIFSFTSAFNHPGLLVTNQDISRVKTKLTTKEEPWLESWNKLTSIGYSDVSYVSHAVDKIDRASNGAALWQDAAAAFNLALRWKISDDEQFAKAGADILLSWANKLKSLHEGGDDDYLSAGLQGYQLANAAELLRDYEPFATNGLAAVSSMLTTVFLPMNLDFLHQALPSQHNVKHFFSNWDLCNMASAQAIAVLANNQTLWDFAIDYFKNGVGNGAVNNAITNIVQEPGTGKPLGQGQESGRDQGHSAMEFQLLGVVAQQAWNQNEDLFSYNDSRILRGAEYFARFNLGNDVPFVPYTNGIVSYSKASTASRGAVRPAWELLYAHYVHIKCLKAPWTTAYLNKTLQVYGGYELGAGALGAGSGNFDGLGWGSLLYRQDAAAQSCQSPSSVQPSVSTVRPSASTAIPSPPTVSLHSTKISGIAHSSRTSGSGLATPPPINDQPARVTSGCRHRAQRSH